MMTVSSKSSFFALSGAQNTFRPNEITGGGTYSAPGAGLYWINRTVGANIAFSLPTNPALVPFAIVVYIKDIKGDAGTYPITITDPAGYLIDGAAQLVLNTPFAAATLVFNGTGWSQVA
jgi:hypothetical protein